MIELERRKPFTDLQIKNRLSKLPVFEQFDFLRGSDILLEKESEITLYLYRKLRGDLDNLLVNIKNELSADVETEVVEEKPLPFDTTTKIGKKLADIAQVFTGNLKRSKETSPAIEDRVKSTTEKKELGKSTREVKPIRDQRATRIKKSGKFANLVISLKDTKQLPVIQPNQIPELPEHEQDRKARSYLKEKLFDDLGEASKREQEILLEKMKLQAMRFTSESARQQDKIDEKITEAKGRKKIRKEESTDVAISQLLDKSHQLNEMYQKDREEHETALAERLQQKQLKSDDKQSSDIDNDKIEENQSKPSDSKRSKLKQRPLPRL
ncbi:unnamed protein product [Schistosoma rodhaini]|uniref:Uncharacterized protein n=1 Tax=Schistosoma mansoni TaxID=6183 RepID=G4VKU3_SCHMA|nr:hypothetical protein Smp_128010 [Schistosoma mansoni]CAH8630714.1 unnamed protein product [Schistosoma rodhaini]|eukprot:XP_018653337.1 hypothetical protein Smp_128010 [Schistosoma mansoni]